MRALIPMLLTAVFSPFEAYASGNTPYVEISIHGLEEVAPPLNRLADAVETLSKKNNLTTEDQQKIIAIIGEIKSLNDKLDNTILITQQKISQTQQEISASIKKMIILGLCGVAVCIILLGVTIYLLFRLQITPLITTSTTSLEKFADAMDSLADVSRQLKQSTPQSID